VVESFGLSEELLKQTSGSAMTQMAFHGWDVLDIDPYWVATSEEELEDVGENLGGVAPNQARQQMDQVRRRKGLVVEEKLVVHAEKQRTLTKMK
jgi:ribosome assembly protein 1